MPHISGHHQTYWKRKWLTTRRLPLQPPIFTPTIIMPPIIIPPSIIPPIIIASAGLVVPIATFPSMVPGVRAAGPPPCCHYSRVGKALTFSSPSIEQKWLRSFAKKKVRNAFLWRWDAQSQLCQCVSHRLSMAQCHYVVPLPTLLAIIMCFVNLPACAHSPRNSELVLVRTTVVFVRARGEAGEAGRGGKRRSSVVRVGNFSVVHEPRKSSVIW